jgi:hypothetical protein
MFVNRPDPTSKDISRDITIIGNACETVAIEVSYVLGTFRGRYGLPPSMAGEGGSFVSQLIDESSGHMAAVVNDTLASLEWDRAVSIS